MKFGKIKLDQILVWAVIIVGVVYVANYFGVFATTGGIGTTVPQGAACLFADTVTLSVTGVNNIKDTTDAYTGVANEPISIFTPETPTSATATEILANGLVANNSVALPCHSQYKFEYGSVTYYNASYPATGYLGAEHAAEATNLGFDLVGAITTSLDNNTVLGSASFTVATGGSATTLGAGATTVPMVLHIRQTTAQGIYKAPLIIAFEYNATAFASARAIGWTSVACPSFPAAITFVATGETNPARSCWVYNQDLKDVSEILVPIQFVASATPPVISNVTILVDDTGGAFKNGVLVTGFLNPDNGQGWGAARATHVMHFN